MKRLFFLLFLLVRVTLLDATNYSVAVGSTETIYCSASTPMGGWITHAYFVLQDYGDAEYLEISYNNSDLFATIKGLKAKSKIPVQVIYCYTYMGFDHNRHVGSSSYYDYVTVTGTGSGSGSSTSYSLTFYTSAEGYGNAKQLIINEENTIYPKKGTSYLSGDYSYGFVSGFGDPTAFEISASGSLLTIVPKRAAWAYLLCQSGNDVGLCKIVADSYYATLGNVKYRCYEDGRAVVARNSALDISKIVIIPPAIKVNGKEYIVSEISSNAFSNCYQLEDIILPSTIVSIGSSAFNECCALKTIVLPDSISNIGKEAFYGCKSLQSVNIPLRLSAINESTFCGCDNLGSITIPANILQIGSSAFSGCISLTSVTIPSTVESIDNNAFANVPNIEYAGSLSGAPWGARSLKGYVEGYMVYADAAKTSLLACSARASGDVSIPNTVTSLAEKAFYGCYKISSLNVPTTTTTIGKLAFSSVPNVNYTGSASGSPWGAKYINGYVEDKFVYSDDTRTTMVACSADLSGRVTVPSTVTTIAKGAFSNCYQVNALIIPDNVTTIEEGAIVGWNTLYYVSIGDGVTNIPGSNFNCRSLDTLLLGKNISLIGASLKYVCKYSFLRHTIINATVPPSLGLSVFDIQGFSKEIRTLYVPDESLSAYKNSAAWKGRFPNIYPQSELTIRTTDKTILNNTILGAQDLYLEIKDNADHYSIAVTLWDAINVALEIWSSSEATQEQINEAITTLTAVADYVTSQTGLELLSDKVPNATQSIKLLRDGHIYILRGDRTYTLTGQEVK